MDVFDLFELLSGQPSAGREHVPEGRRTLATLAMIAMGIAGAFGPTIVLGWAVWKLFSGPKVAYVYSPGHLRFVISNSDPRKGPAPSGFDSWPAYIEKKNLLVLRRGLFLCHHQTIGPAKLSVWASVVGHGLTVHRSRDWPSEGLKIQGDPVGVAQDALTVLNVCRDDVSTLFFYADCGKEELDDQRKAAESRELEEEILKRDWLQGRNRPPKPEDLN